MSELKDTAEYRRLHQKERRWRAWGPYVSDRAWGTVRDDESSDGDAWRYLPHDQARSRAYRWGEDGIGGLCDEQQQLCFALALWNGQDSMLKERFFGLDNDVGKHSEAPKDYWFYLDATPSYSYARMLYKYPQAAFPYLDLLDRAPERGRNAREYDLADTGIFTDDRYFDVDLEYAKADADDVCIRVTLTNRGPEAAELHVLPTLWFRNTWSWGPDSAISRPRPALRAADSACIAAQHETLGRWLLTCAAGPGGPPKLLFTENETNTARLFGCPNAATCVKDGIHEHVVNGRRESVNPEQKGTKASAHYTLQLAPSERVVLHLRLCPAGLPVRSDAESDRTFARRIEEADAFYAALQHPHLDEDTRRIQRQAWAGMLWSKQWYGYSAPAWQRQDSTDCSLRAPNRSRRRVPVEASDVISMPDKWEYPWFAAWDLGLHCVALAYVDPAFAKKQLLLMASERYQHPSGTASAYVWSFDDANPPVLARAAYRVFQIERDTYEREDRTFLETMFLKLALNFAWWVSQNDLDGNSAFEESCLGLGGIGVLDRSQPLPSEGFLAQLDATSWVAMFCLDLATIALELANENRVYRKLVAKYAMYFMYAAQAMNSRGAQARDLWDEADGAGNDCLRVDDHIVVLRVRSMVGLIPLFATALHASEIRDPELASWFRGFIEHRPALSLILDQFGHDGVDGTCVLSLVDYAGLEGIARHLFRPSEFLSDYGVRSRSCIHNELPYPFSEPGQNQDVTHDPAELATGMLGGIGSSRGAVWFPVNYFLITALRRWHHYFGDSYTFEYPAGSARRENLSFIADDLSKRLLSLFRKRSDGRRPANGGTLPFHDRPWGEPILFYEYFHGDSGAGLGASHQTGRTGLIAALVQELGRGDRAQASPSRWLPRLSATVSARSR